ncbi:uncharacterized protein LOC107618671 [Arachis ipaensis]|uniref:uncharacterized protein LOC107618671 n=1 Tax=Arachis ipaensis TaxID=130454 RepID=UPI000A2B3702|nr:uncharacterized protein LOC107618671 [Arachis ipaensis]
MEKEGSRVRGLRAWNHHVQSLLGSHRRRPSSSPPLPSTATSDRLSENAAASPGSTTAAVRVAWKEDELGVAAPCLCRQRAPLNPLAWVEYRCLHVVFGVFSYFVMLFQLLFLGNEQRSL